MNRDEQELEKWRDIPGYEGRYQISNLGKVKSLGRIVNKKHGQKRIPEKILKPLFSRKGYPRVSLRDRDGFNRVAHVMMKILRDGSEVAFEKGAQWLHQHLMNEAAGSMEEAYYKFLPETHIHSPEGKCFVAGYQASQLHSQRRMEEMKKDLEWALEYLTMYAKHDSGGWGNAKQAAEIHKKWGLV